MSAKKVLLVIGFGFCPLFGGYCFTNKKLSEKTFEVLEKNKESKAFIQWSVSYEMQNMDSIRFSGILNSVYIYEEKKEYVPTLKIIKYFREWQKKSCPEMQRIILITAPPLWGRCLNEIQRYFPGVNVSVETFAGTIEEELWFMERSTLWWTRSKRQWKVREKMLSLLPWRVYEFLFS